ncbi:MAG: hypothetical protein RR415_12915 [Ruthenibacterium sp.]
MGKSFDFERGQYDLLCACLEANDAVLFEELLQYYIVVKIDRPTEAHILTP